VDVISNHREVTLRVVIPRFDRFDQSIQTEIQSIARVDQNFRSRLAVQERYNETSFFRLLSRSLQGVALPASCERNNPLSEVFDHGRATRTCGMSILGRMHGMLFAFVR
jgi:hypothetical protein